MSSLSSQDSLRWKGEAENRGKEVGTFHVPRSYEDTDSTPKCPFSLIMDQSLDSGVPGCKWGLLLPVRLCLEPSTVLHGSISYRQATGGGPRCSSVPQIRKGLCHLGVMKLKGNPPPNQDGAGKVNWKFPFEPEQWWKSHPSYVSFVTRDCSWCLSTSQLHSPPNLTQSCRKFQKADGFPLKHLPCSFFFF